MSRHAARLQFLFADGSVRAATTRTPLALADVAAGLRGAGGASHAFLLGAPGPLLLAAQAQLRLRGVVTGGASPQPHTGVVPALLLMTRSGPGLLLLDLTDGPATPLLLPAVQGAREAARRIERDAALDVVLVLRAPGASAAPVPHDQMALNFEHIRL